MRAATVDDYILSAPKDAQEKLRELRQVIKEIIPTGEETISYGIPTVKRNGRYVVYFAGYKNHVSLYPILESIEKSVAAVATYKKGRGTMQFPLDKPLPLPLIRQIVKLLVKENEARGK